MMRKRPTLGLLCGSNSTSAAPHSSLCWPQCVAISAEGSGTPHSRSAKGATITAFGTSTSCNSGNLRNEIRPKSLKARKSAVACESAGPRVSSPGRGANAHDRSYRASGGSFCSEIIRRESFGPVAVTWTGPGRTIEQFTFRQMRPRSAPDQRRGRCTLSDNDLSSQMGRDGP
jgi:hypothetical protein